jgi:hypothetical protein
VRPFGVAATSPAGNVSVNATPVRVALKFRLVMVNDREITAPTRIDAAPNTLLISGGVGPDPMKIPKASGLFLFPTVTAAITVLLAV